MGARTHGLLLRAGLGLVLAAGLLGTAQPSRGADHAAGRPAHTTEEPAAPAAPDAGAASEEEALAEAARTGEPVEVLSLRGESSDVHATPEGTLEAREYLRPVRARVDGAWRDVDTDLVPAEGGMVAPAVATVDLAFSGGGDQQPMARMTRAGRTLELYWPGALPEPRLDGSLAVYENVLPGADLRLGAEADGFTQLLVVHSAEAAASPELAELSLRLEAEGMSTRVAADGGLEAIDDGAGTAVFEAPAPLMWDSSTGEETAARTAAATADSGTTDEQAGEPGAGESARQGRVDVEVTDDHLVLTPDQEILHGEDTTYPVYIDPQWYSPRASAWTMASRYWHDSPQWLFNGENNAGLGYCGWDGCMPKDLKRLFYRVPTSRFADTDILSAEFVVPNVHSASCTAREVQLWRTRGISSSTTWDSQNASGFWVDHLDTRSFAHGWDGCAAQDAEFDVTSAVQQAADGRWSTLTFGMRATSEGDPLTWKRFSDDAHLRVEYNRPPAQIRTSQLSMEYGGTCKPPSSPAMVATRGKLYAVNVTDPDGDRVSVEFAARWDTGDGQGNIIRWSTTTTAKASGSTYSVTLPSNIPQNRRIEWAARAYDGAQYGAWSSTGTPERCAFVYDATKPKAPAVTSPQYPEPNTADPNDPWHDGVGKYGSFTFDAAETDVVRYEFRVMAPTGTTTPTTAVTTSSGAARTVQVLPETAGVNRIIVRSFDGAGNGSEERTYLFSVRAGEPERMVWGLDEESGATAVTGQGEPWEAALSGDVAAGAAGIRGEALELGGASGYASMATPVLDTSKSYSVSLWARLPESGLTGERTAVSANGMNTWAFLITADPEDGWSFKRSSADASPTTGWFARQDTPPALGQWTHVVAVFNNVTQELLLYVDGRLVDSSPVSVAPWEARGATTLGARLTGTHPYSFFNGRLDEVQFYDYGLSAAQVGQLHAHQPITQTSRPAKAIWSMDEPAGAVSVVGHSQPTQAQLHGAAQAGQAGLQGRGVSFDGSTGHAATTQPVLDTYQSFTVSLWAKLPADKENRVMVAADQLGAQQHGFALYHRADGVGWSFLRSTADTADASHVRVNQNPCSATTPNCPAAGLGTWTHVVGVYDGDAQTMRLYINGDLEGTASFTPRWNATGPVLLGSARNSAGLYNQMEGTLDDVRFFDRTVTASEVRQLFEQRPVLASRWQFETTGPSGDGGVVTPDSSAAANALRLGGGPVIGPGWVDSGALTLDGVDDYAATPRVPVDTTASFTVAAWAQAAAAPDGAVTLVSAAGTTQSAFSARFVPDPEVPGWGAWQLALPSADSTTATVTRVHHGQAPDVRDWNHVALVHDGFRREAQLYVNGRLAGSVCTDEGDTACEPGSTAENVLTFRAGNSLQAGRTRSGGAWGEYWPGAVDDLWTFQGTLSPGQIANLAAGTPDAPTEVP
ncbi:LamG-like jellyroll fold domain-containing protein [Streptomyces sp. URMC 129]|uniref:LamG-like jellyroll fold domain-containing protein n=1 Tax=Streptomyces sp. URMC 129 TaxID=3423407 RepID=UPI003F1D4646